MGNNGLIIKNKNMKKEIIYKLHELEYELNTWISFKNSLKEYKNIAIMDKDAYPRIYFGGKNNILKQPENLDDFFKYILKYADEKINYYTKEIENL
jgi:hypothetical protein